MEDLCFASVGAGVLVVAAFVSNAASVLANVLPNPADSTGFIKYASLAVNWLAINFKVKTVK